MLEEFLIPNTCAFKLYILKASLPHFKFLNPMEEPMAGVMSCTKWDWKNLINTKQFCFFFFSFFYPICIIGSNKTWHYFFWEPSRVWLVPSRILCVCYVFENIVTYVLVLFVLYSICSFRLVKLVKSYYFLSQWQVSYWFQLMDIVVWAYIKE